MEKIFLDFDVLIWIEKPMACLTSSIDLLYLVKTSWCHWIIFIKENLILFIFPFCFNIWLNNCLQLRERFSILLVALQILRNSKMASLQGWSQSYIICQIIEYGILHFPCKSKDQEKWHKNCYFFLKFWFCLINILIVLFKDTAII